MTTIYKNISNIIRYTKYKFVQPFSAFKSVHGYTLTELAISTSIMAMLAVGALAVMEKKDDSEKRKRTLARMAAIEVALKAFVHDKGYVPCPASPALLESNTNFGRSVTYDATIGVKKCTGSSLANETGAVPVRTLGIDDEDAYDGWDRKFAYRSSASSAAPGDYNDPYFHGNIAIMDLKGTHKTSINEPEPNNDGAIYVIISYGPNGKGVAYNKNDATVPSTATGLEEKNTDHTKNVYIQNERSVGFDDIVTFGTLTTMGRQKIAEAPAMIQDVTCETAYSLSKDGRTTLNNYASAANASSRADTIYKSAKLLSNLCRNKQNAETEGPSRMKGLQLWLDVKDTGTLFTNNDCSTGAQPTNNDTIGCWKDKSGNGFNVTQSSAGSKPTYQTGGNFPKLLFDGSNDSMLGTYTGSITNNTVFVVANLTTLTPTEAGPGLLTIETIGGATFDSLVYNEYTAKRWMNGSNGWTRTPNAISSTDETSTNIMVLGITRQASNYKIYQNSTPIASTTSYSPPTITNGDFLIGLRHTPAEANGSFAGGIYEAIVYNRVLSDPERHQIESYLGERWGVPISAPLQKCIGGMVFLKTPDDPRGSCKCPSGQTLISEMATGDACYINYRNVLNKCVTKVTKPVYTIPPTNAGMSLWLDAGDCTTIRLNDNTTNYVQKWRDKSPNGNHATQNTQANQPSFVTNVLNGRSIIRGRSTGYMGASVSYGAAATFIVVATPATATNTYIFSGSAASNAPAFVSKYSSISYEFLGATPRFNLTPALNTAVTGANILSVVHTDGGTTYGYFNSALVSSGTGLTISGSSLTTLLQSCNGCSTNFDGDLAEFIIYNRALASVERENIESYLATKWGIIRNPTDITGSNLKLWLDATDTRTVYNDSSCTTTYAGAWDKVGCWKDKSSNANNAVQATTANQPVYGSGVLNAKQGLMLNGLTTYLSIAPTFLSSIANDITIFIVASTSNMGGTTSILGASPDDSNSNRFNIHLPLNNSNIYWDFGNMSGTGRLSGAWGGSLNAPYIWTFNNSSSPAGANIWRNGNGTNVATKGTSGTPNYNSTSYTATIGTLTGGYYHSGTIHELIIYNRAITTSERRGVESYLGAKWGIAVTP